MATERDESIKICKLSELLRLIKAPKVNVFLIVEILEKNVMMKLGKTHAEHTIRDMVRDDRFPEDGTTMADYFETEYSKNLFIRRYIAKNRI